MNHLDEGTLQAYLDGELPPTERAAVEAHVRACIPCRKELDALRDAWSVVGRALDAVDASPRTEAALSAVRRRAGHGDPARPGRGRWSPLRAASVVLLISAAAVAALPASPVRQWLETVLTDETADETAAPLGSDEPAAGSAEGAVAAEAESRRGPAAVSIVPRGPVTVALDEIEAGTRIHVRFVDGFDARVEVRDGSERPLFRTGLSRIELRGGRGEIVVEIPEVLTGARLTVNGGVWLEREGGTVRMLRTPAEGEDGAYTFVVP